MITVTFKNFLILLLEVLNNYTINNTINALRSSNYNLKGCMYVCIYVCDFKKLCSSWNVLGNQCEVFPPVGFNIQFCIIPDRFPKILL